MKICGALFYVPKVTFFCFPKRGTLGVLRVGLFSYRKRGSNPHGRNAQGILSPSCLPFHHSGTMLFLIDN